MRLELCPLPSEPDAEETEKEIAPRFDQRTYTSPDLKSSEEES
jgi:hypothetical protein